jgi:ADP-ribosylglycohydrolase
MHLFRCAEDCIYRTSLNTQGTANANQFIDDGHCFWFFLAVFGVERRGLDTQKIRQSSDAAFSAWRTLVDTSLAAGNGFGIGPAARVVALAALGLRQDGIDLVYNRIGFDMKSSRRPAQPKTEQAAEERD